MALGTVSRPVHGGGGLRSKIGTTETANILQDIQKDIPITLPPVTPVQIPQLNTGRIRQLQRQFASPGLRRLRRAGRESLTGGAYENPAVRSLIARRTLEGLGQGIADITGRAGQFALGVAGQERAIEAQAAIAKAAERNLRERMKFTDELATRRSLISQGLTSAFQPTQISRPSVSSEVASRDAIRARNFGLPNDVPMGPSTGTFRPGQGFRFEPSDPGITREANTRSLIQSARDIAFGGDLSFGGPSYTSEQRQNAINFLSEQGYFGSGDEAAETIPI